MAWIVSNARVLASVERAATRRQRTKGLLGRDGLEGAFVIDPCKWIHTIGMKFPIDVAYVDAEGTVVKLATVRRYRLPLPVSKARFVIEASAGAFERWDLHVGDPIEIRL
jgi:uncharacterized protein